MGLAADVLNVLRANHTPEQKLNYLRYRLSKKDEVLSYDPVTISIVATTNCTLSCDMCPTHSRLVPRDYPHIQTSGRDMDIGMFRDIIDIFKKALEVHIIGSGEPLLNKDFFTMVDYASSRKMTVKTFSNGTMIRKNVRAILDSKLSGITVSLNGHDSKEFARMTGIDERIYSEVYESIGALVGERDRVGSSIRVKLSFIIDTHNYMFIPDMIDVGLKLGVDHIFFSNFLPAPYAALRPSERTLTAGGEMMDKLHHIFNRYSSSVRKKLTPPIPVDEKSSRNNCVSHFSQIRFDGDGNVSSCSMMLLNMSGHGNYRDRDVWNNDFFRRMRRAFMPADDREISAQCKVCPDNKGVKISG